MANLQNLTPFKPGNTTGKLGGRPKGSISISKRIEKLLESNITLKDKHGNKKTQQGVDWLAESLFNHANKGNMKAMEMLIERVEGKVHQSFNQIKTVDMADINLTGVPTDVLETILRNNGDEQSR